MRLPLGHKIIFGLAACLATMAVFDCQVFAAENELTVSLSTDHVVLDAAAEQFVTGSQIITVSTTNLTGYTVNLSTTGVSTSLINTEDSALTIPTFILPGDETSLPFGSTGYGYGYSTDEGANYLPAPDPAGLSNKIFETRISGSNDHILTFGTIVEQGTTAGEYTNTFLIQVVANDPYICSANLICYRGNGDDGTGEMETQSTSSSTSVMLRAPNFSRPGYGFAGWNTEPDGSGTNYGPSQTITTGDLSEFGLMLYANWIPSEGNLQEWHSCNSLSVGAITALTDTRDGSTYAVAKYVDGNCWFMENMRLDLSDSNLEISALNTNNPTTTFATAANLHPASTNNFCSTNNAACIDQILFNVNNMNRELTHAYDTNDTSSSWYSYGGYYNWYTATAGHGTYSLSTPGATTSGDLCPAGWRLPTAYNSDGNYAKLDKAIGGNGSNQNSGAAGVAASERWRTYPLNYIYSGEQNGTSAYNRGISGGYNTANVSNGARSINFWIRSAGVNVYSNSTAKNRGQTIRCLTSEKYEATGTIHYDANGGTGTMADQEDVNFATATAATNDFSKEYNEFVSWNTKADGTGTIVTEGGSVATAASDMGIVEGGTLTLYAIWRPFYAIVYDGNNAGAGSMDSARHDSYDPTSSVTLVATNFSREGYGFAGWSLDANAASKIQNNESVTIFGPNETVPANSAFPSSADENNTITLYAVWLPSTMDMQSFGASECSALSAGDILALTDERDQNSYSVAKLADGNCWMVENLRLDPSSVEFTNDNTHAPTADFISAAPTSISENTLCSTNSSSCIDKIAFNSNNINRSLNANYSTNNNSSSWYGYGMMYNWYTVSAGNGTSAISSGNVSGDICPSGWRLPTGGESNVSEVFALNAAINSGSLNNDSKLRKYPNNFIYSGDYNTSKPSGRSTYGRYWTSTASDSYNAYRLGLTSSDVTPVRAWNKWVAFPARCMIEDHTASSVASTDDTATSDVTESDTTETDSETEAVSTADGIEEPTDVDALEFSSNSNDDIINNIDTTESDTEVSTDSKSSYSQPLGAYESVPESEEKIPETNYEDTAVAVVIAAAGAASLAATIATIRSKEDKS